METKSKDKKETALVSTETYLKFFIIFVQDSIISQTKLFHDFVVVCFSYSIPPAPPQVSVAATDTEDSKYDERIDLDEEREQ